MENSLRLAYSEVNKILSYMDKKEVEKIPSRLRETFKNEREKDYEPNINPEVSLLEQNLQRNTLVILSILNLNYWCGNEEKKQLVRKYTEYDKKIEEELREKYNPDNIFKDQKEGTPKEEKIEEAVALTEYQKINWIKRIFNKIKQFFKTKKEVEESKCNKKKGI